MCLDLTGSHFGDIVYVLLKQCTDDERKGREYDIVESDVVIVVDGLPWECIFEGE